MKKIVETESGKKFEVVALTRKQVKILRAEGNDPFAFDGVKMFQGTVDAILDLAFPDGSTDDLPFPEALKLAQNVISATMGTELEEKNS